MYIRTRDESIELLSETLKPEQLRKAITQKYSDTALSVMVDMKSGYGVDLVDSVFSADAINKLTAAYARDKISDNDLYLVTSFASRDGRNEPYIDDFLDSIDKGLYHETAAKIFAAIPYEKCSYKEATELVETGAFYPTNSASLAVSKDVALELFDMCYPLRACEDFNNYYDIDTFERLNGALERGAAIIVPERELAVAVKKHMALPDWADFREYTKEVYRDQISLLTGELFNDMRTYFERDKLSVALYDKVNAEYNEFISGMQKETVGVAIESAYEIVWKDNIAQYCENETPRLSQEQYAALLSADNTLNEVYWQWLSNGELHSYDDIEIVLKDTADVLSHSIARQQKKQQQQEAPVVPEQKQEDVPAPTEPKRRSR